MKKLALFVLLILVAIGAVYANPANSTFAKELPLGDLLTNAFTASGASPEGYSVHNWSVVNNIFTDVDTLANMGQKLNQVLQIQDLRAYKNTDGKQNIYQLYGKWDSSTDVSMILSSMQLDEQAPQTSLVIKVERNSRDVKDLTQSIEKVKKTVSAAQTTPQISTCIKGFLNDRIKITDRDQLIKRVFSRVNANEIEGIRSEQLMSVSGYSRLTKEHIVTGDKKMNLQVVVQWDEYQQRTRVLVGAPIVTIEY